MGNSSGVTQRLVRTRAYKIAFANDYCVDVIFEPEVYAVSFFENGRELQTLLEEKILYEPRTNIRIDVSNYRKISIDLSQTVWFDTLALGYLILFLYDAKAKYIDELDIEFILPYDSTFLAFLVDNGFYRQIQKLQNSGDDNNFLEIGNTYYSSVHKCFYPFDVFESEADISDKISDIRLRLENAFSNSIKPERLNHFINKIAYFMYEAMENVFDHAYGGKSGRCAILIKNVNCSPEIDYGHYSKVYTSKTPYIKINLYEDSDAYLEAYVMDTGCGITKSYSNDLDISDVNILGYIFENGKRSHKKVKDKATEFGGLYDIAELFNQDADGLGIKSDTVWKYVYKYDKQKDPLPISLDLGHENLERLIHGFALVASIHLPKMQDAVGDSEKSNTLPNHILDELISEAEPDVMTTAYVIDERWDMSVHQKWHNSTKNSTVIYPPSIALKRWIVDHVYDNERENLFFVEVPDAEEKKYQSNISNIKFSKVQAQRIFVITKSLSVSCYVRGPHDSFLLSKEKKEKYIHTTNSDANSITKSFSSFLLFDKLYNSWRFWTFAKDLVKNYSFIAEQVKWGDKMFLSGYLDFSQINRIPECRDICIQKLNELRVLKGGVYFNSTDRFTDEICERANFIMGGQKEGESINVGSVFVSGKSSRLINEDSECYYFLCHPNSIDNDTKTLLDWLRPDKLPKIVTPSCDSDCFARIGNSSFVARGGANYWLKKHYGKMNPWIKLDNSKLYKLLQRRVGIHPDALKIGHFESTERHDLFGYRVNYLFDSDTVDRQLKPEYKADSIYDFLTTNFLFSLYGNINETEFNQCINDNVSIGKKTALWEKCANANDRPYEEEQGIIVYFFDFQTSMLVEKIEKLLKKSVLKKIIPIIPLSRNYEMGALIISPLVLDRIEEQILEIKNDSKKAMVTIFDSVVFNVRLLEEVKQILYAVGADQVRVLSVLDRRRIPISEIQPTIKALGRVDVPALHGNDRCSTCRALERLDKCKKQVQNSDLVARIEEIISRWQCIQLSDNEYMKGMESNAISLSDEAGSIVNRYIGSYWGETLKIELDTALCSLVMEYAVISASAQFLIDLLDADSLLKDVGGRVNSDELKILLASVYLLLFATNAISNKQVKIVGECLRKLLDLQKNITPFSELAVVALSSLSNDFMLNICKKYEVDESNDELYKKAINYDALIARIIILLAVSSEEKKSENFLLERAVRCYLVGFESKVECLYDIFMYSEKSYRNSHRHAFSRIIDDAAATKRDYQNALEYTKKIKLIVLNDEVFASLFHDKEILNQSRAGIVADIDAALDKLKEMVELQKRQDERNPQLEVEVKQTVDKYVQNLKKLNTGWLYLQCSQTEGSETQKAIINWLDYCKEVAVSRLTVLADADFYYDVQANVPNNWPSSSLWFYSFGDVTEEIINLMVDILQYRDGKMSYNADKKVDGGISIRYRERYVEILFYNKANKTKSIEEIRDIKKSKSNRDSMLVFKEFEKRINDSIKDKTLCFEWDYIEGTEYQPGLKEQLLRATMRIPYINRGSLNRPDVFERKE